MSPRLAQRSVLASAGIRPPAMLATAAASTMFDTVRASRRICASFLAPGTRRCADHKPGIGVRYRWTNWNPAPIPANGVRYSFTEIEPHPVSPIPVPRPERPRPTPPDGPEAAALRARLAEAMAADAARLRRRIDDARRRRAPAAEWARLAADLERSIERRAARLAAKPSVTHAPDL